MDILLFTQSSRKAEYFSLKLKAAGHTVFLADTLAAVHHILRYTDPDFVITDSETFPEPRNDYRTIIQLCRRKFLLFYDYELLDETPVNAALPLSDSQRACLCAISEALADIRAHRTLVSTTFPEGTAEERQFLKDNKLRPQHAQLLSCLLRAPGSDITTSTLLGMLWADNPGGHLQTLYAYINQLRILLERRNIPLIIERRMKGTYSIRFAGNNEW